MQVASFAAITSSPRGVRSSSAMAEDPARGGQRDPAAEALEKLGVQLLLQLPDLGADGGLRAVAGLRRFGEALQPNDLKKRVELVEIHRRRPDRLETKIQ